MSDTEFDIDTSKLTPANQNPWYILMTLYGEQEGDEIDWELHKKNRRAWNSWACRGMSKEERKQVSDEILVPYSELDPFEFFNSGANLLFDIEWRKRNPSHISAPEIPDPKQIILIERTLFLKNLYLNGFAVDQIWKSKGSVYSGILCFEFSSFRRTMDPTNCFINSFIAKSSLFHGDALFMNTKFYSFFCQQSQYFIDADFVQTSFISKFSLLDVSFYEKVNFYSAKFQDSVHIFYCNFNKSIIFDFSEFKMKGFYKEISFSKTQFIGPVYFINSIFYMFILIFKDLLLVKMYSLLEMQYFGRQIQNKNLLFPASLVQ